MLAFGIVKYAAGGIVLLVCKPFNCKPKWADESFYGVNDMICSIIQDPYIIVEGLSQQISDAYEEEGIGYCIGYTVGSVVGAKGIDKASKFAKLKLASKSGVVDDSANIAKTGARNLDSIDDYLKADAEAQKFYKDVLNIDDVDIISNNSGLKKEIVEGAKEHLFKKKHLFEDGSKRMFDPDIEIADSWRRLTNGNFIEMDKILLKHEYFESKLMNKAGVFYERAHNIVKRRFDYIP